VGQDRIVVSTEVERLLTWAYRTEAIDDVVSAAGSSFAPMAVKAAGFSFGGGGGGGFGAAVRVNEKALLVHNVVLRLRGWPMRLGLVVMHAKTGSRPDWLPKARLGYSPCLDRNGKKLLDRDPVSHRATLCHITHRHQPAAGIYHPSVIDQARVTYLYWAEGLIQVASWLMDEGLVNAMPDVPLKPWSDDLEMVLDTAQKT